MAERKKKWAKRLPRRRVHGMALGGVIKHMGWKLSSFTRCSRGCCWLFFGVVFLLLLLLLLQSEIYSWTQTGGQPADVCFTNPPDVAVTLLWDRELRPRSAAPGRSSSLSLPFPATRCLPWAFNNIQSPDKTPQLHKWLIYFSFKKKKKGMLLHQRAPNPGRKKYSPVTVLWQGRFHCIKSPLRFSVSLMETSGFFIPYTNQRKSHVSMW